MYVSYVIGRTEYESKLNGYISSFYEGKKIDIYYDKFDYHKIGNKDLDKSMIILPLIGFVFLIVGSTGFIIIIKKNSKEKHLKAKGHLIYAYYLKTEINSYYTLNDRHPYYIVCVWDDPENGIRYTFKSKNLWDNPEPIILSKDIKQIPVYIDLKNKNKYHVDTDFIF